MVIWIVGSDVDCTEVSVERSETREYRYASSSAFIDIHVIQISKSPVIQQTNKMKDIWRIFALNDCFLQYLNFVILSILVRNAAQQKCESEGNKRGRHKEC